MDDFLKRSLFPGSILMSCRGDALSRSFLFLVLVPVLQKQQNTLARNEVKVEQNREKNLLVDLEMKKGLQFFF